MKILVFCLSISICFGQVKPVPQKDKIPIPKDELLKFSQLQGSSVVLEREAALVQKTKENLELKYDLLIIDIYKKLGVSREDYQPDFNEGVLKLIDKAAEKEKRERIEKVGQAMKTIQPTPPEEAKKLEEKHKQK